MQTPAQRILNVFVTVDTEVYPIHADWRTDALRRDIDRDVYGRLGGKEYGLRYSLEVLRKYDLKGSFFVEPLFSYAPEVGDQPLRTMVEEIQTGGQEVQMHLHPEWVPHLPEALAGVLEERKSDILTAFSAHDQNHLIRAGFEKLVACGARNVRAFRAGDYAANFDTLSGLRAAGLEFDTSYNECYLDRTCQLRTPNPVRQPVVLDGILEIPVSCFEDWPGHFRHAQLCAVSTSELILALEQAWQQGWWSFVIVSHSFEFLMGRRTPGGLRVRPEVVDRFEQVCQYLDAHRQRFQTAHFGNLQADAIPRLKNVQPLRGRLRNTLYRMGEQARNRLKTASA